MFTMFRSQQPMFPANGGPPPAAGGVTVVNIGSVAAKAVTTQSITVPAGGVPAGSTIFVALAALSSHPFTPTDTAGNTYTTNGALTAGGVTPPVDLYFCANCLALAAGNTITVGSASNTYAVDAFYATGLTATPLDAFGVATGTSAAPTMTTNNGGSGGNTGTTTQTNELVIAIVGHNGPTPNGFSQDGRFSNTPAPPTATGTTGAGGTTNVTLSGGYEISTALANYQFSPAITSAAWTVVMGTFQHA